MKASDIPLKLPVPFASSAGGSYVRNIPTTSQIGISNGAASLPDGFPPLTFQPEGSGGIPPFGQDFNGILREISAWSRWTAAGGAFPPYDAAFQTAIDGYPNGIVVTSATTQDLFWLCLVDDNMSNPDMGGAGWKNFLQAATPTGIGASLGAYLQFGSATVLVLSPIEGGFLWINGSNIAIPPGVTLSNAGLAPSTFYYVYAFVGGGGAIAMEASTTGYTLAANGIPQKTGDVTRTLVGAAFTNSATQFADGNGYLGVISWFNRQKKSSTTQFSTAKSTTSVSPVEIDPSIRCVFITWGEPIEYSIGGQTIVQANTYVSSYVSFDGLTPEPGGNTCSDNTAGLQRFSCQTSGTKTGVSAGASHYVTLFGLNSNGVTATWNGVDSNPDGVVLTINIVG